MRQSLFGGDIIEVLPTEQPQITNRRVDMLVRNQKDEIWQVEFQTSNEPDFPFRMLEYWVYLTRQYGTVYQTVLYLGRDPMQIPERFEKHGTVHPLRLLNLREWDAAPLLASHDWADNLLALLARGEWEVALDHVLHRVQQWQGEARNRALGELTAISGILKVERSVLARLEEFNSMIDLWENDIIRPELEKAEARGEARGEFRGERLGALRGERSGKLDLLRELLDEKFGQPLPEWAQQRLEDAKVEDLDRWARNILRASTLEETLN